MVRRVSAPRKKKGEMPLDVFKHVFEHLQTIQART